MAGTVLVGTREHGMGWHQWGGDGGPVEDGIRRSRGDRTGADGCVGHKRLGIIDPDGARLPMYDRGAGLAVTFDGEIYNFRELRDELCGLGYSFALESDTDVLMRAYQHCQFDAVNHPPGLFASPIWHVR